MRLAWEAALLSQIARSAGNFCDFHKIGYRDDPATRHMVYIGFFMALFFTVQSRMLELQLLDRQCLHAVLMVLFLLLDEQLFITTCCSHAWRYFMMLSDNRAKQIFKCIVDCS